MVWSRTTKNAEVTAGKASIRLNIRPVIYAKSMLHLQETAVRIFQH
jgi:hypothetical protein